MATLEHEPLPPLSPAIRQQLHALRAGIRRYIWLEGLAAMAVWVGAAFWGSMALDWMFEPPRPVRAAVLVAAGLGLAVVLFLFILRRVFVRLSNRNMATVLERQFPQLNDSLLTSVSLLDRPVGPTGFNPEMLAHTGNLARQRLENVPLSQVFNPMPVVRKVVIALGLALAVVLLAVMDPKTLNLWAERNLLLANAKWPRKIRLEAVGFTDGVAKVVTGGNFDLRVRAFRGDTELPVAAPDKVEVRYRPEGGSRERKTMKNIGQPATSSAAGVALQEYSHAFTSVLASMHIDVVGGDARIDDLQLKVVPNPNLTLKLVCEYPAYMERAALTIDPVSGAVPVRVPIGSRVTLYGTADKPLEAAWIDCPAAEGVAAWHQEFAGGKLGAEQKEFTYSFEPFPAPAAKEKNTGGSDGGKGTGQKGADEAKQAEKQLHDYSLQLTLRDTDGFKARDPLLLTLVPVPDEPPEVKTRMVGTREPCVTPQGRVPVAGPITDDHALGRLWFHCAVEGRAALAAAKKPSDDPAHLPGESPKAPTKWAGDVPLVHVPEDPAEYADASKHPEEHPATPKHRAEYTDLPKHPAEYVAKEAEAYVTADQLSLVPGQRLSLTVQAADLCTLGNGPNIGSGETWQLDVVTEDELVTRLEAQELLVKQRFEQIVEEMTETRNLLLKMSFTPPEKSGVAAPKVRQAGAEPGEREEESLKLSAEELAKRRLERTLQALQNCRKNALETADVAAAIEEIRLQLDNNQANTPLRKTRIETQVLQPLHFIVKKMFPVLDGDLEELKGKVENLSDGPKLRDVARKQADDVLAEMRKVLEHMMTTADFNILVVQRLKKIIEKQRELTERTKKTGVEDLEK